MSGEPVTFHYTNTKLLNKKQAKYKKTRYWSNPKFIKGKGAEYTSG